MQTIRQSEESEDATWRDSTPESQRRLSIIALSNLCDKIHDSHALITNRICRSFSLEELMYVGPGGRLGFLPKHKLMRKLEEYSNLINAMGALSFVSRQMTRQVPCVFNALREFAVEQRAGKIQDILSSGQSVASQGMSGPAGLS